MKNKIYMLVLDKLIIYTKECFYLTFTVFSIFFSKSVFMKSQNLLRIGNICARTELFKWDNDFSPGF